MTYDLRRLRLHGLIERIPHSHRYQTTADGLKITLFRKLPLGVRPRNTPEGAVFFAGVLKQDDSIMFHGQELSSLLSG
jgi:hypothetical protein